MTMNEQQIKHAVINNSDMKTLAAYTDNLFTLFVLVLQLLIHWVVLDGRTCVGNTPILMFPYFETAMIQPVQLRFAFRVIRLIPSKTKPVVQCFFATFLSP